jgi:prolyl-tRNA synthetase
MRYRDLDIRTRREQPARVDVAGEALLIRASYLTDGKQPTRLGERAIEHLRELAASSADLPRQLGLQVTRTQGADTYFDVPAGGIPVLRCLSCGYAEDREIARCARPPPPDEAALPLRKIPTPDCSTIESLAAFLGTTKDRTAKALLYTRLSDLQFVFAVVRGDMQISRRKVVDLVGDVRAATEEEIVEAGAAPGYASPVGLTHALVIVDDLVPRSANLVAGANETGFHLQNTNYGRDYMAQMVSDLALASSGDPCPNCGTGLASFFGMRLAGTDGWHFRNLLAALAEAHHDEKGLRIPWSAGPFDTYLMQLPARELNTRAAADDLYARLQTGGISVLYDDRDERAGVKFNDADLIGCPVRLTVGERGLKDGMVELKYRDGQEVLAVRLEDAVDRIRSASRTNP